MEGLVIGFIFGCVAGLLICICSDDCITDVEFRKAKIEVELDKCCENAYNYGYERGKLEGMVATEAKYRRFLERRDEVSEYDRAESADM